MWARSCAVALLCELNCSGQNDKQKGGVSVAWTRPCCASLPGLRNRFWQCPQKCTITATAADVESAVLDSPSDALLEAMPSNCHGGCTDTATAVVSAAAAAVPALRFARGSCGSIDDRLRVYRFGGDLPSASIAVKATWRRESRFQNHRQPLHACCHCSCSCTRPACHQLCAGHPREPLF